MAFGSGGSSRETCVTLSNITASFRHQADTVNKVRLRDA